MSTTSNDNKKEMTPGEKAAIVICTMIGFVLLIFIIRYIIMYVISKKALSKMNYRVDSDVTARYKVGPAPSPIPTRSNFIPSWGSSPGNRKAILPRNRPRMDSMFSDSPLVGVI